MYESPIEKIYRDITNQMIKRDEENLLYQVNQAIGYRVDKEELLKALRYDREQYEKGYEDGKKSLFTAEETEFLLQCLSQYFYSIDGMPEIVMSCYEKLQDMKGE